MVLKITPQLFQLSLCDRYPSKNKSAWTKFGTYFVNGKSTEYLTAYDVHSKKAIDIASENATQPIISPDSKRVMYITLLAKDRNDLWVSNIG